MAPQDKAEQVKAMVTKDKAVNAQFVSATQGMYLFRLGTQDAKALTPFFEALEGAKHSLGITDVSIGNATLDDVFINLALGKHGEEEEQQPKALGAAGAGSEGGAASDGAAAEEGELGKQFHQRGPADVVTVAQPSGGGGGAAAAGAAGSGGGAGAAASAAGSGGGGDQGCGKDCRVCCLREGAFCCDFGCRGCCACCCSCQADQAAKAAAKAEATKKRQEAAAASNDQPQSQVYALLQKSLSFQLRQKKLMCCLIMFPTIFIALISLLGTLVFTPLTEGSLNKLDWSCVQESLKLTSYSGPSISVGSISEKNSKYKDDDYPPLYGLETPSFEFYVSGDGDGNAGSLGSKSVGTEETFGDYREWLAKFEPFYDCSDDYDKASEEFKIRDKKTNKEEKDNPNTLRYAEEYATYGNQTHTIRPASCKKSRAGLKIKRQLLTPPTATNEANYKTLQASLDACNKLTDPSSVFTNSSASVDTQVATTTQGSNNGLLNFLSFAPFLERRALDHFNGMMDTAYTSLYQSQVCLYGGSNSSRDCRNLSPSSNCAWNYRGYHTCDYAPPELKTGTPSSLRTNVAKSWCAQRNVPTADTSPHRAALETALESDAGTGAIVGKDRVESFCAWFGALDAVRGMRSEDVGSKRSNLNKALWRDWEGEHDEVTDTMVTKFTSLHFSTANANTLAYDYVAYYNLSGLCGFNNGADEGCDEEDMNTYAPVPDYQPVKPVTSMMLALQSRVDAAIFMQSLGVDLEVDTKSFPQKLDKCAYDFFGCASITDFIASAFLPYIFMLYIFVIQGLVVFEKSSRLRDIMVMSGLKMHVYWAVLWAFYFAQYLVMMLILWVAGVLTKLRTFSTHDPGVLLLFFIAWGNCMIAFSFMLTTFFKSPVTATVVTLLVTILSVQAGTTVLTQLVLDSNLGDSEMPYLPYMWFPPLVLLRGILWLTYGAAFNAPIDWSNFVTYGNGGVFRAILYMVCETPIMVGLTWYFEIVLADGGSARHPLFFVHDFKEWVDKKRQTGADGAVADTGAAAAMVALGGAGAGGGSADDDDDEPEDVKAERVRSEQGGEDQAVRVVNFRKVFPNAGPGGSDKVAVKDLSFAVNKNECFGLLGHNGAGKTTTISMLCGLFKPTSGQAVVAGFDLATEMASVHENMGVCPQHDILWNDLTAKEHLLFYARLRKIPVNKLAAAVDTALAAVNLSEWGDVLSSKFSGGMKRRLSTACSLVGEPKVVYMDEPSTGLDPASRHRLWEVIAQSKGKNSILLTTHSMEEADVLCERIGIMGAGSMLCLGTSLDLKSRFGAGYRLSLHIKDKSSSAAAACRSVVTKLCPSARLLNEPMGGIMDFEVPRAEVRLSIVYAAIEEQRKDLGILDWGITESTLEEVFLAVTGHDSHKGVVPGVKSAEKSSAI
jgi:ABC-type multidrug transport system ATPase subunit